MIGIWWMGGEDRCFERCIWFGGEGDGDVFYWVVINYVMG